MTIEWSVPIRLDSIHKSGLVKSIEADESERKAIADRYDLYAVNTLCADIKVKPQSDQVTYFVSGVITADIIQRSVISGDKVPSTIDYSIEGWYQDQSKISSFSRAQKNKNADDETIIMDEEDAPEILKDGIIDIGDIVSEFLGLALDDYPRTDDEKEGAGDYIEVKPEDAKPNPFAKLADLKK
jgi:uncharacterized metal-binding protein YceD (DUF177 family)